MTNFEKLVLRLLFAIWNEVRGPLSTPGNLDLYNATQEALDGS